MTNGTLHFNAALGEWVIKTTPDVTVRIKRIFPRVTQEAATLMRLKETPEIANDLEWILIRFPMAMEPEDASRLQMKAKQHRDKLEQLELIVTSTDLAKQFQMAYPPREYQSVATALYLAQGFLLCADVVGLGKTIVGISSLTDKRTLPALVVVKTHLQKQWMDEIKHFIPTARVHIIKKCKEYKLPDCDVYVISYSKLSAWWGIMAKKVKSVIYDEAQELRIATSAKYKAAKFLNSQVEFKLSLSATPVCNYGGEIWNVLSLIAPDALGTEHEFQREWCYNGYGGKWLVKDPVALGHHLISQKMMVRRTRKEVGRVLPPIIKYVQEVEFDKAVYEKGLQSTDELALLILNGTFEQRGQAARQFDLRIRQSTGVSKAPYVAELVRMLIDSGEKVLLGGWHRSVYDIWADRLKDLKPAFFTGHESDAQKEKSRVDFIDGRTDLLIMSLRSGAGINGLQKVCSVAVLGELDWSPAIADQFTGRLARDGQEESVQVFIPVAPIGSDPTIAQILAVKSAQASGIVDLGVDESAAIVETDPQRIRQLAISYLKSRNISPNPIASESPLVVS